MTAPGPWPSNWQSGPGAAVWVSPVSSRGSFPEDHPAFAGFLTPHRRKLTAQLSGHDVVVVLGAPVFTNHVHSGGPFLPAGTDLFQLVDDPQAAALAPVGTAVLTTLRVGLAQHRLPISFVVLNNGAYVALKALGRGMGLDCPPGVDLPGIELAEIARGFGCPGSRVDTAQQFEAALRSSLAGGGPTLLDVGVDPAVESLY